MSSPVWIKGTRCPACSNELLYVAEGGYITCSWADCPNPDYQAALDSIPVDLKLYDLIDHHVHENTRYHLVDWPDYRRLLGRLYRWREETTERLIRKNWAEAFKLGRKAGAEHVLKRLQASGHGGGNWRRLIEQELAALFTPPQTGEPTAKCFDCNRPYGEPGFPDLIIPTWAWNKIAPYGPGTDKEGGAGLLCPSCICERLERAGIKNCPSLFASGPLKHDLTYSKESGIANQPEPAPQTGEAA